MKDRGTVIKYQLFHSQNGGPRNNAVKFILHCSTEHRFEKKMIVRTEINFGNTTGPEQNDFMLMVHGPAFKAVV